MNKKIKDELSEMDIIQDRKDDLPYSSINRVCNRVMAIEAFNIMTSVSNKMESRLGAEFSVRSTIAFMMTVLTSHFIRATPSLFHSKQSDVKKILFIFFYLN